MQKAPTGLANHEEEQGVERQDHYDSDQNQKGHQRNDLGTRKRYTSGYQSGLSPLKETDTASVETSQTQEEKQEAQSHEQQALQEFYNNYRNPLARLRARFPEAPAEFIAVSNTHYNRYPWLISVDGDLHLLWYRG